MRHRVKYRGLNRTMEHRWAMRRNMAQSFFEHGQIRTTVPKAKTIKPFVEKLITMAVKVRRADKARDAGAALRLRREIHKLMGDRTMVPREHQGEYDAMSDVMRARTLRMASGRRHRTGEPKGRLTFTGESVIRRLIEKVAVKCESRPGGYTRLIRLADKRLGDKAPLAIVQLVGEDTSPGSLSKPAPSARKRRANARYAAAVKAAKGFGKKEAAEG